MNEVVLQLTMTLTNYLAMCKIHCIIGRVGIESVRGVY